MNREELLSNIKKYQHNIGMWKIELGEITDADFVIGYGYDDEKEMWKVFQNSERGMQSEWFFSNEDEAISKLFRKINFQYKISN